MTYRIKTYEGLQANLSAANTAVMLRRASIGRIELTAEERSDLIWRIERHSAELEAMILELTRAKSRIRPPKPNTAQNVIDFRAG